MFSGVERLGMFGWIEWRRCSMRILEGSTKRVCHSSVCARRRKRRRRSVRPRHLETREVGRWDKSGAWASRALSDALHFAIHFSVSPPPHPKVVYCENETKAPRKGLPPHLYHVDMQSFALLHHGSEQVASNARVSTWREKGAGHKTHTTQFYPQT